jgi:hypothetical protein
MRVILQAILTGKVTPSSLAEATRTEFPKEWSDDVFKTHVSGLIARLGDLRLVRRQWQGRFVTYEAGDRDRIAQFLKGERRPGP